MRSFAILFGALSLATAVPAQEPAPAPAPNAYYYKNVRRDGEDGDGAFLGVGTMQSGSKRDTLGLLVTNVTPGSPADKAGIVGGRPDRVDQRHVAAGRGRRCRRAGDERRDDAPPDARDEQGEGGRRGDARDPLRRRARSR